MIPPMRWLFVIVLGLPAFAVDQNPSPMVEHTREHPRSKESHPEGRRHKLSLGTLFVPEGIATREKAPLLVFMHGGAWIPEVAAAEHGMAALVIQSKSGYSAPFAKPDAFPALIREAETEAKMTWSEITLGGWSAGCHGIREIAKSPDAVALVGRFLFIDGIHTSYAEGKPGPLESKIDTATLAPIVSLCRLALQGQKSVLITHSEIFPGTFASTTETADWLLRELKVKRQPVLRWGPMKTQILSEARQGRLELIGLAGNSAPDHVDQLYALGEWLKTTR